MTNKIEVKLRVKKEMAEKLKAQAEKEGRSTNNLLEKIIKEYLEKENVLLGIKSSEDCDI